MKRSMAIGSSRFFNGQKYEQKRFAAANENNRRMNMKLVAARTGSVPIIQLVAAIGIAGVVYFAIADVLDEPIEVGTFVSFLGAVLLLIGPVETGLPISMPCCSKALRRGKAYLKSSISRWRMVAVTGRCGAPKGGWNSSMSPSGTNPHRMLCLTGCHYRSIRAKRWPSSADPVAGNRPWSACCRVFMIRTRAA